MNWILDLFRRRGGLASDKRRDGGSLESSALRGSARPSGPREHTKARGGSGRGRPGRFAGDHVPFVLVELEQGTREWLEWRHDGIGASDAATIVRENRFKTAAQLLQEKRLPVRRSFQTKAMALGKKLEPEARRRYIARTGTHVRPVCVQSTLFDWLRASLDGLSDDGKVVVEIKCGASAYRAASRTGAVPDYYYGQVQHILAVTGLESLDFWCYWPGEPEVLLVVERDEAYIERLIEAERDFWSRVKHSA